MTFQGYAFVFSHVEQGHFVVGASEHDIRLEEVKVDDVSVLVGVIFGLELEVFIILAVLVLKEESVGVATIEKVLEGFDFIEGRNVTVAKSLRIGILNWLRDGDNRLLLNHFMDLYKSAQS